jgi:hypothetical protein
MPAGKWRLQFVHARAHRGGGLQRVAAGRKLHADAGGRLAVQARCRGVSLRAQFDARHVLQAHAGAIGIGAQLHVAKLFDAAQLAVDHHGGRDALAGHIGQVTDAAGRDLGVLRAQRGSPHRSATG